MLWYPQADLINQLYQGKLKDYVRCLECGYESWRIDTYLDIPLVIRPFGASQAYGSVVGVSLHLLQCFFTNHKPLKDLQQWCFKLSLVSYFYEP